MLNNIWLEFLKIVTQEVGSRVVETWLKAVVLSRWDNLNQIIYIEAPNAFVKDWLSINYIPLFVTHLSRLLNVQMVKVIIIDACQPSITNEAHQIVPVSSQELIAQEQFSKRVAKTRSGINKNYQFSSFVVGPNNSLAFAAAQAVTEKPGKLYNPLFIYGNSGLGKTHLLHAIGNEIKNNNKRAEVLYQTTDRFVNEFIHAIRFDKVHQFQSKYKNIDILLIDDVQFISNKEQTQEAFFHIFNSLYEAHKQIVFSSDSYPADIKGLAERLSSRLECGLVTDIQMPTIETKMAILKHKAELNNVMLTDEVAEFIAYRVTSNIRELEGSLIRIMAFASITKQVIGLELAKKVLLRTPYQQNNKIISAERILSTISTHYQIPLEDLKSEKRQKQLSLARQVAMYFIKKFTKKTLYEIGSCLNRKDHSTVIHALNKVDEYKRNNDFLQRLKKIEQEIAGV